MQVVAYHYVRPPGSGLHALAPETFAAQLDWFEAHGGVVDARAFTEEPEAPHAGEFLLTFDDGLREHAGIADLLTARGYRACFFVCRLPAGGGILNPHRLHLLLATRPAAELLAEVEARLKPDMFDAAAREHFSIQLYRDQQAPDAETRLKCLFNYHLHYEFADALLLDLFRRHLGADARWNPELYLGDAAVRRLAATHVVGNHSHRHRVLARLSAADQAAEIGDTHNWLEALTGTTPLTFCYPYGVIGSHNADTLGILHRLRYRSAFRFSGGGADQRAAPLEIDRIDCNLVTPSHP